MSEISFENFYKMNPVKAAEFLPRFKANVQRIQELRAQQAKLLNQVVFHVALKAKGVDCRDVRYYVREHLRRVQVVDSETGESKIEYRDAVDWKTVLRHNSLARQTNRIAGVVLNDGRVIKFDEPIDDWK